MATLSVWNYGTKSYEDYEVPGDGHTHAGTPPRARGSTSLGSTPEQVAWKVPAGARKVGRGPAPKGRIASLGAVDDATLGLSTTTWLAIAAGAYLLWRRKKRR